MFLNNLVARLNSSLFRYEKSVEYLTKRGTTKEEIEKYKIGYSNIIGMVKGEGAEYDRFMKVYYSGRFIEGKLVFPLFDIMGQVVGIQCRHPDTKEIRTFVLKETETTGFFFGLFQALPYIYNTGKVFVVEGPFDLIAFSKVYPNCVASLTAGLNDAQFELLGFFSRDIIVVFDSDKAGRVATEKVKKRYGVIDVNIGYKDPSECLSVLGLKKFIEHTQRKVKEVLLF